MRVLLLIALICLRASSFIRRSPVAATEFSSLSTGRSHPTSVSAHRLFVFSSFSLSCHQPFLGVSAHSPRHFAGSALQYSKKVRNTDDHYPLESEINRLSSFARLQQFATRSRTRRLGDGEINRLLQSCSALAHNATSIEGASILWSIGTLKLSMKNEDTERLVRQCLLAISENKQGVITAEASSLALIGLARLGCQQAALLFPLLHSLQRSMSAMDAKQVASTVHSLGKLRVDWAGIPLKSKKALSKAISRTSSKMSPQGFASTLQGVSKLQALQWGDLIPVLQLDLLAALERTLPRMDVLDVSSSVSALGRLDAPWADLPDALQDALLRSCLRVLPHMDSRGISMCVFGLGRMDFDAPASRFRRELVESCSTYIPPRLPKANAQDVASMLCGLGRSGVSLHSLPASLQAALLAALWLEVSSMSAQGLAHSLLGLSRMGASLAAIPSVTRVSLWSAISRRAVHMNEREVCMTLHALGGLGVTASQVPPAAITDLCSVLSRCLPDMATENIIMAFSGLQALQFQWNALPPSLAEVLMKGLLLRFQKTHSLRMLSFMLDSVSSWELKWAQLSDPLKDALRAAVLHSTQEGLVSAAAASAAGLSVPLESRQSSPCLVTSLGRMDARWIELGSELQAALTRQLRQSLEEMSEVGLVGALGGLASMGLRWSGLKSSVKEAIQRRLVATSAQMGELDISQVVLSLSRLEVSWTDDLGEETKASLRAAITRQSSIGEHALSSLLYGLSQLGRTWPELAPEVRRALKEAIVTVHLNDVCSAQGVSYSLYGLANMGAYWNELSSSVRLALIKEVVKVAGSATDTQLTNIMWSLARMGARRKSFSAELWVGLLAELERRAPAMNRQHLSTALWSLGAMCKVWESLPTALRDALLLALRRVEAPKSMGALRLDYANRVQSLSMLLAGLGNLHVRQYTLPRDLSTALVGSVAMFSTAMTAGQLANGLQGLSKMGWQPDALHAALPSLYTALLRVLPLAEPADAAAIIAGVSGISLTWRTVPLSLRHALMSAAARVGRLGGPDDVSLAAYGLGSMECVWELMPERVRSELMGGIIRVSGSSRNTTPQAAANLMYAVSLLCFDVADPRLHRDLVPVHLALLTSISVIGIGGFIEKERGQILIFLQFLRHLTTVGDMPAHRHIIRVDQHDLPMSRLQMEVVHSLTEALELRNSSMTLENEYSAFGGTLPVDATVFRGGRVVAFIEIDGPHHYYRGVLRRKDHLKEALYRKKHPGAVFARVKYDCIKRLGYDGVGEKVADFLAIVDPEREEWANRRAERELKLMLDTGRLPLYSEDGY